METKEVEIKQLKKIIFNTFNGDNKLIKFFDPLEKVSSVEEISCIIERKIIEYIGIYNKVSIISLIRKNKIIGFFIYSGKMLISFGLNIKYRTKENLLLFFNFIKSTIGDNFYCTLYTINERAINWLKRMGLKVEENNILITKLTTQCQ